MKKWSDPIPTSIIFSGLGVSAKASVALAATLTRSSSSLMMNNVDGNLLVTPIPGISVKAIPIGSFKNNCFSSIYLQEFISIFN